MAEIQDLSTTDASNTGTAANAGFPENMNPSDVNNAARALEGMIARLYADTNGSIITTGSGNAYVLAAARTIASYAQGQVFMFEANHANTGASTLNVDSVGAKAIVKHDDVALASGDIKAGQIVFVAYEATADNFQMLSPPSGPVGVAQGGTGVSSLTDGHILIGTGSTITSGAFFSSSTGNLLSSKGGTIGKQTIYVPAAAMRPEKSNGCSAITDHITTAGRPDISGLLFDGSSDEFAVFNIGLPKGWNEGVIQYRYFFAVTDTAATDGSDTVSFALQGVSVADDATIDVNYGTAVNVTQAISGTVEDIGVSAISGDVTIASAAENTLTFFRIGRDVSEDNMAEDCVLLGAQIFYTINAAEDS